MTNKINNDKIDKIAVLRNSRTPEKIPADWWKKLAQWEINHMRKNVIPVHGDVLSPRDRELLRSSKIIMKDGIIYRYTDIMKQLGEKPKKLTPEEITAELLDRAEDDRIQEIGELPYWESEGITREEWHAKQAKIKAKLKQKVKTRAQWAVEASKHYGRKVSAGDVEDYMYEHESVEDRHSRELDELMNLGISSFRPGARIIYDHEINRCIAGCVTLYVFYTYPIVLYTLIALVVLYYVVRGTIFYFMFKRRAQQPFAPDPKSRFSEEWQREAWEGDRKRWGYDKEDVRKDK